MAKWEPTESRKIAVTTTSKQEEFESLCMGVVVTCDADCYIDFGRPATTGSLLLKANQQPCHFPVQFTELSAICASTANLYILALR